MSFRSLAIALFVSCLGAAGVAGAEVRIALLPIAVHASGSEVDYLQAGLAEMIAARLDQYEGVAAVAPDAAAEPPESAEAARSTAREAGAAFVLYGSFTRFGDGASLDLRCARVGEVDDSDDVRRVFIQSGTLAEIIPQLDTLTQKVARYTLGVAAAPRVAGTDGSPEGAAAAGPTAADYQALLKRVEALERAGYKPMAAGEAAAAGPATDADAAVVR